MRQAIKGEEAIAVAKPIYPLPHELDLQFAQQVQIAG